MEQFGNIQQGLKGIEISKFYWSVLTSVFSWEKKGLDVTELLNFLVLIDLEFSWPYSFVFAAEGGRRNELKFNKFHPINDGTDELQIESGGWRVLAFNSCKGEIR